MAVLKSVPLDQPGPFLAVCMWENGIRTEGFALDGADIRTLRVFVQQGLRGDTVSEALRELHRLLNETVYQQAFDRGWGDRIEGRERVKIYDPLFRDGYNDGYDQAAQNNVMIEPTEGS